MILTDKTLSNFIVKKIANKYKRGYVDMLFQKITKYDFFFILYGIRRIGKTTICFQIIDELIKQKIYSWDQIGFIDIEQLISLGNSEKAIKDEIYSSVKQSQIKFLFIDEIQLLENWDMFLKSIRDIFFEIKIIASGSSSYCLKEKESGVGRFFKIKISPLTLREFIELNKIDLKKIQNRNWLIFIYLTHRFLNYETSMNKI